MHQPLRQDSIPTSASSEGRAGERAAGSHPPHPAPQSSTQRAQSSPSTNPFASLTPSPGAARDASAETKLFEVPRELIEMARARAKAPGPSPGLYRGSSEALTPVAPRPTIELQATLLGYTAPVSNASMSSPAALGAITGADSEPVVPFERRSNPRLGRAPIAAEPVARSGKPSQLWLIGAGAILASCAYILLTA